MSRMPELKVAALSKQPQELLGTSLSLIRTNLVVNSLFGLWEMQTWGYSVP